MHLIESKEARELARMTVDEVGDDVRYCRAM